MDPFDQELVRMRNMNNRNNKLRSLRSESFAFDPNASPMRPNQERAQIYSAGRGGGLNQETSNILADHAVTRYADDVYQGPMPNGAAGYGQKGIVLDGIAPRTQMQYRDADPVGLTRNSSYGESMMNNANVANHYNSAELQQRNRDNAGVGLTREEQYRRRMDMRNFDQTIVERTRDRNFRTGLMAMEQGGMTTRTGMEQRGQTERSNIAADASRFDSGMDLVGSIAGAAGGVVGSWLQQGVEKIRQKGETSRLDKLLGASGMKGDGVYQDATGKGVPVSSQQPIEPGATPVYDEEGYLMGRDVMGRDGKSKFMPYDHKAENPFDPVNSPNEYKQWEAENPWPTKGGSAPAGNAGQGAAANRIPPNRMPFPGMKPTNKEGEYLWQDGGGTNWPVKMGPDGWQMQVENGKWEYLEYQDPR
jgi:hypothetical protein